MKRSRIWCVLGAIALFVGSPRTTLGFPIGICNGDDFFFAPVPAPAFVDDGVGGLFVLDDNALAPPCHDVRVSSDGVLTPWPAAGASVPLFHKWATSDGAGGLLAVWLDASGPTPVLRASRWNSVGDLAPGWAPAVAVADSHATTSQVSTLPDGHGGAFLAWVDDGNAEHRLYAQHLASDGTTASAAPVAVCSVPALRLVGPLASDGADGVVIVWTDGRSLGAAPYDVYAQRLDAGLTAQWTTDGVAVAALGGTQQAPVIAPDGSGGEFVAWEDDRAGNADIYLQRLTTGGSPAAGWIANGVPMTTSPAGQHHVAAITDGAGGVFLAWSEGDASACAAFVNRIGPDGQPATGWKSGGQPAGATTAASGATTPQIASDHAGGVRVAWADGTANFDVFVQTFAANGTRPAGWPPDGVIAGTTVLAYPIVEAAVDASDGTVFVVWSTMSGGTTNGHFSRLLQHLGADGLVGVEASFVDATVVAESIRLRWYAGSVDPAALTLERTDIGGGWAPRGSLVTEGAYLVFEDRDVRAGETYGYRLAWTDRGQVTHTAPQFFTIPAISLTLAGAEPNPASTDLDLAFSLAAGGSPGRIEIFDLAGRRWWSHAVESTGPGRQRTRVSERLPSGVYRVRLTQGTAFREATVTVLR